MKANGTRNALFALLLIVLLAQIAMLMPESTTTSQPSVSGTNPFFVSFFAR